MPVDGRGADHVLAQPDFGSNGENRWTSVQRDTLCWPYGLSLRGDTLAVADSGNNRVMVWRRRTMRPRIVQTDDQIGFYWATPSGAPTSLQALVVDDDEPDRLVATHLEALDDALIMAAKRFGEVLGGGRSPADAAERDDLLELHRTLDRLCFEYAAALEKAGLSGRPARRQDHRHRRPVLHSRPPTARSARTRAVRR